MNTFGPFAGIITLLIIGLGFPLVIYGERLFGAVCWPYYMSLGILVMAASLLVQSNWVAVGLGVLGATLIWASTELKEQAMRALLGWFPLNTHKIRIPFGDIIEKWQAPHL
jgi:hypothetical protein